MPWREQQQNKIKQQIYSWVLVPFIGLIVLMFFIVVELNHRIHEYQDYDIQLQKTLTVLQQQQQNLVSYKEKVNRYDQDMHQLNEWQENRSRVLDFLNLFNKLSNKSGYLTELQFQDQMWQLKGVVPSQADFQKILQLFDSHQVQIVDLKSENQKNIYNVKIK